MKKILLLILLLTSILFPQLKEFEVKQTTQKGGIPVNRDNPEKAAIFFYTQFDNLSFWSNYGIVDVKGDPAGGKYIVIIEPVRQSLEVRAAGFKTELIKIPDLQPRDVLYYEVLPKDKGLAGVTEVGITVQAVPSDAVIKIDGSVIKNDAITPVKIGKHILSVEKSGYNTYSSEIDVTPQNTLFKVTLSSDDPLPVTISSVPEGADIILDGVNKGKTKKTFYSFPGVYSLKLNLSGYLSLDTTITVTKDDTKNTFTFSFKRNTGVVIFEVQPSDAEISVNKERIYGSRAELSPGTYQVEASARNHYAYKGNITVALGETKTEKISLVKQASKLQFAINPVEAKCVLSIDGRDVYNWSGFKIINDIPLGEYQLVATLQGYKTLRKKIFIREGQTTVEDLQMEAGSDLPEWLVYVDGKTFKEDGYEWSSFYISKYEVTQELWKSVMKDNPSYFKGDKRPVENASWYDAIKFCNALSDKEGLPRAYYSIIDTVWDKDWGKITSINEKLMCNWNAEGYRLPSEDEWEFAARGGKYSQGFEYSGSNTIREVCWGSGNSDNQTHDVGLKKANELGIYDMSGNVWEWCWNWFESFGSYRVLRGGGWDSRAGRCGVADRYNGLLPDYGSREFGFRLVRTR